jgi:hypothetical protein
MYVQCKASPMRMMYFLAETPRCIGLYLTLSRGLFITDETGQIELMEQMHFWLAPRSGVFEKMWGLGVHL